MYTDWSGAVDFSSRHGGHGRSNMRRNINIVLSSAVATALAIAPRINVGVIVIRGWVVPPHIPFIS